MCYAVVDRPGFHGNDVRIHSLHSSKGAAVNESRQFPYTRVIYGDIKKPGKMKYRTLLRRLLANQFRLA